MKKTLTRVLSLVLVLTMLVGAAPMVLADTTQPTTPTKPITAIELSGPSGGNLPMGTQKTWTALVTPTDTDESVVWESSDPSIATVSGGVVTPVAPGEVTITAKGATSNVSDSKTLNVRYQMPSITSTLTVKEGKTVNLPEVNVPGLSGYTVSWDTDAPTSVLTVNSGNTVTGVSASTPVRVIGTITGTGIDGGDFYGGTNQVSVLVTVQPAAAKIPALESNSMTVNVNEMKNPPKVTVGDLESSEFNVTWSASTGDTKVKVEDNVVTGLAVGTTTIYASVTPKTTGAFAAATLPCSVEVKNGKTINLTKPATEVTLAVGTTGNALPTYSGIPSDVVATDYTVTWTVQDTTIATVVDNSKLSAHKVGTTKLTATFAPAEGKDLTFSPNKLEWTLKVNNGIELNLPDVTVCLNDTHTLPDPVAATSLLTGGNSSGVTVDTISYARSESSTATKNTTLTGYSLKADYLGRDTYTATATLKQDNVTIGTITETFAVSVYSDIGTINVVLKDTVSTFTFNQTNMFKSLKVNGQDVTSSYASLDTLLNAYLSSASTDRGSTTSTSYPVVLRAYSTTGGTLSHVTGASNSFTMGSLSNIKFTKTGVSSTSTGCQYSIEVTDPAGLLTMTGTIQIDYKDTAAINYTTGFNTAVTFKESDFVSYWNTYRTSSYSSLKSVRFTVLPYASTEGTLYTNANRSYQVQTTYDFVPYYTSGASYDLDTVTFMPANKTVAYTVTVPFTATGTDGSTLSGSVVITVGAGVDHTISRLGFTFGRDASLHTTIANRFSAATNATLDYVVFTIPQKEVGQLFYNFTSNANNLLNGTRINSTTKLYYNATGSNYALANVTFFPSAKCPETVTLYYTAYGTNSTTYNGTVTLKVTSRTSSYYFTDVKNSTSWASDAVDVLHYLSVVNGTNSANTQFSPSNKITRAHFMLMLYRAFLADRYSNESITSNFSDITKGSSDYSKELYQAVGVAKKLGIATGDGKNYYPNKNITREEAMTLIYRTLDELNINLTVGSYTSASSYSDYSKITSYAKDAITYLVQHDVVTGDDTGKLNPRNNITRAEMAAILYRVLTY